MTFRPTALGEPGPLASQDVEGFVAPNGPPPPTPKPLKELSIAQRKFIEYYASRGVGHGAAAVRHAELQTEIDPAYTCRDLLRQAHIANALRLRRAELAKALEPTAEKIIKAYAQLAFTDRRTVYDPETGNLLPPHKLPEGYSAVLAGHDAEKGTLKLLGPEKALDALAKMAGLFEADNKQKGAATGELIAEVTDLDLARRIAWLLTQNAPAQEEAA